MPHYEINYRPESHKSAKHKLYREKAMTFDGCSFQPYDHPLLIIVCSVCHRKITHFTSVIVQYRKDWQKEEDEQTEKEYDDLCVHCFIFEINSKKYRRYWIRKGTHWSLTEKNWNVRDQSAVLAAIQKFGFGNWQQTTNFMRYCGCNITLKDIQSHYSTFYLQSSSFLPIYSNYPLQWRKSQNKNSNRNNANQCANYTNPCSSTINPPSLSIVIGYKQKRDEFLLQYDYNAEESVAGLQFSKSDTQEQRQLKQQMLLKYVSRLQQRYARHKFVLEHRLLDEDYQKQKVLSTNTCKRAVAENMLLPYSRFNNLKQQNELISLITFEKQLQSFIIKLKRYRKWDEKGSLGKIMQMLREHYSKSTQSMEKRSAFKENESAALMRHFNKYNSEQSQSSSSSSSQTDFDIIKKKIVKTPGFSSQTNLILIKERQHIAVDHQRYSR